MAVVEAVTADLAGMGDYGSVGGSVLAASALVLAAVLDSEKSSATSKAACARSLNETMAELRALTAGLAKGDRLDELGARRAERRAG